MGFLFFQNEKCVAGFAILLLLEVMARRLQCRWCINTEIKGGLCSLIWIWGVVGGQSHYLNRNLDFFLIQSPPMNREICYGPNHIQFNAVLIPSREWIQIKPSLFCKEPVASAFLQTTVWFPVQHPSLLCLGKALLPLDFFFCSFLWGN